MSAQPVPRGGSIAGRLLLGMTVVLVAAGLAAWLVARAVGPTTFHEHMRQAMGMGGPVAVHAEEAFVSASTVTLTAALGAAAVTALLVSVALARRLGGSLRVMASAAEELAAGRYDVRVPEPRIGAEFDSLARVLNELAARLEHVEALRGRLIGDVAHELRTPVATITAYLDGLEDGVAALDDQTVAVLRAQAGRLTRLSSDLGAVSRAESGELTLELASAPPDELVRSAARTAAERFRDKGVRLDVEAPPGLPAVRVDVERFGQVLGNLLDNALRHTPTTGHVTLAARRLTDGVRFVVADDGEGIDPQHLPYVFERFYRADSARDREHGGSGIGLAISRALVTAHGGTITAQSAGAGTGATFVVDLSAPSGQPRSS